MKVPDCSVCGHPAGGDTGECAECFAGILCVSHALRCVVCGEVRCRTHAREVNVNGQAAYACLRCGKETA